MQLLLSARLISAFAREPVLALPRVVPCSLLSGGLSLTLRRLGTPLAHLLPADLRVTAEVARPAHPRRRVLNRRSRGRWLRCNALAWARWFTEGPIVAFHDRRSEAERRRHQGETAREKQADNCSPSVVHLSPPMSNLFLAAPGEYRVVMTSGK